MEFSKVEERFLREKPEGLTLIESLEFQTTRPRLNFIIMFNLEAFRAKLSDVLLKKVDPRLYARLKAEAAAHGKTVGQAFNEAVKVWLSSRHGFDEERERDVEAYLRIKRDLTKHPKEYFVITKGAYRGRFRTLNEAFKAMKMSNATKGLIVKSPASGEWLGGSLED